MVEQWRIDKPNRIFPTLLSSCSFFSSSFSPLPFLLSICFFHLVAQSLSNLNIQPPLPHTAMYERKAAAEQDDEKYKKRRNRTNFQEEVEETEKNKVVDENGEAERRRMRWEMPIENEKKRSKKLQVVEMFKFLRLEGERERERAVGLGRKEHVAVEAIVNNKLFPSLIRTPCGPNLSFVIPFLYMYVLMIQMCKMSEDGYSCHTLPSSSIALFFPYCTFLIPK
jgi:hypothetical protein